MTSESDSAGSAQLRRRLWTLRLAVLPWLVLVLGPMVLEAKDIGDLVPVVELYGFLLIPATGFHLAMAFLARRPGLAAAGVLEALLVLFTIAAGRRALAYVPYVGWRPVIWAGLVALSQLTIALLAWRAWRLAPADRALRYVLAFAVAQAPFMIWSLLAPVHGWVGHRIHANESSTIGDIRSLISAEVAYQSANGGFYDVPECLAAPTRCMPGYPANAPTFLDSLVAQTTAVKSGYRRVFHPGPPADPAAIRAASASASSLQSYSYVAVPIVPGETGVRGFCGDATGLICRTEDGSAPPTESGGCAASCQALP